MKAEAEAAYQSRVRHRQAAARVDKIPQERADRNYTVLKSTRSTDIDVSLLLLTVASYPHVIIPPPPTSQLLQQSTGTTLRSASSVLSGGRGSRSYGPNCDSANDHKSKLSRPTDVRWKLPRICVTNLRGLRYRVDELTAVLETIQIDMGCITESWLGENITTDSIDITNFTCYRHVLMVADVAALYATLVISGIALD
jgi:hypothetical protein